MTKEKKLEKVPFEPLEVLEREINQYDLMVIFWNNFFSEIGNQTPTGKEITIKMIMDIFDVSRNWVKKLEAKHLDDISQVMVQKMALSLWDSPFFTNLDYPEKHIVRKYLLVLKSEKGIGKKVDLKKNHGLLVSKKEAVKIIHETLLKFSNIPDALEVLFYLTTPIGFASENADTPTKKEFLDRMLSLGFCEKYVTGKYHFNQALSGKVTIPPALMPMMNTIINSKIHAIAMEKERFYNETHLEVICEEDVDLISDLVRRLRDEIDKSAQAALARGGQNNIAIGFNTQFVGLEQTLPKRKDRYIIHIRDSKKNEEKKSA